MDEQTADITPDPNMESVTVPLDEDGNKLPPPTTPPPPDLDTEAEPEAEEAPEPEVEEAPDIEPKDNQLAVGRYCTHCGFFEPYDNMVDGRCLMCGCPKSTHLDAQVTEVHLDA